MLFDRLIETSFVSLARDREERDCSLQLVADNADTPCRDGESKLSSVTLRKLLPSIMRTCSLVVKYIQKYYFEKHFSTHAQTRLTEH